MIRHPFSIRLSISIPMYAALSACAPATDPSDPGSAFPNTAPPNVILLMADDQGYGDVGYYGWSPARTPVLDRLAAEGLRFDNFYAAAPVCSPTRGSVMTGRHPNRYGCFSWGHTLRKDEVTVAQALKLAGYRTGHFGKWHLGHCVLAHPTSPGNVGFDEYVSAPNFYVNDPVLSRNGKAVEMQGEGSQVTVEAALDFIRGAVADERPFLAVVWFGAPHSPHEAYPEDLALFQDLPEEEAHYYGEISAMDRSIGFLLDELENLGVRDDTLVWFTSDNGPQGPEGRGQGSAGPLRGRKASLWEGGIRVPAVIHWPGRITTPLVTRFSANTSDIYPTLVEIVGVEVPDQPKPLDGISLVPVIEARLDHRPAPMGFWVYPAAGIRTPSDEWMREVLRRQQAGDEPRPEEFLGVGEVGESYAEDRRLGWAAWIDGRYKLHRIPAGEGDDFSYELYDLVEDVAETRNLSSAHPDRVRRMAADLETWQSSVLRSLNGEDYVSGRREEVSPGSN